MLKMKIPAPLQKGDKICVVSPAGKIKSERVLPAIDWLNNQGYKVVVGEHVFTEHFQFAGTDGQRLNDLQKAINDTDCKAIICARGGYGTIRLIDELNFSAFEKHPKWLVGYSDITILHHALNKLQCASIHGTMPPFFLNEKDEPNENLQTLLKALRSEAYTYQQKKHMLNRPGSAKGELIGGNLSIITSLLGTKYEIDTHGKILFLEDIDEYLYHIDRMMYQLKLAGKLNNLAGLVIGDFTDIKDNDTPFGQSVEEIISEVVKNFDYPVAFGFSSGHGEINKALTFGIDWKLDVNESKAVLASC
jgi:muramoyltetrapeptide carboxypeptidase